MLTASKANDQRFLTTTIVGLLVSSVLSPSVFAGLVTFEGATYPVAATTPFLNRPANIGPFDINFSFTGSPAANVFSVSAPNPAAFASYGISGRFLIQELPTGAAQSLRIDFSRLVIAFSTNFAINSPAGGFARLDLTSSSGNVSVPSQSGPFLSGGFLEFLSLTPFSFVTLTGFHANGAQTNLLVDNVFANATAVPEPTSWVLTSLGVFFLFRASVGRRQKRKFSTRNHRR
jgi:hypothetical protein